MKKLGIFILVIMSILLIPQGVAAEEDFPEHSLFVGDTAVSIDYLIYHPDEAIVKVNELVSRQGLTMKDLWYRILNGSVQNVLTDDEATAEQLETIKAGLLTWIDENGVSHPIVTYTITFDVNVDDAVVTFDGVEYDAGDYIIDGIKGGTYNYSVSKFGYNTLSGTIEVHSDITVNIVLEEKAFGVGTIKVGAMTFNELTIDEVYGVSDAAKFSVDKVGTITEIGSGDSVTFMGTGSVTLQIYDDQDILLATGIFQVPGSLGEHELSVDLETLPPGEYYTLEMSITGEGTVVPAVGSHRYNEGTVVDISAIPDDNWKFTEWQLNGAFYSDEAETTITMNSNKSVTALFEWDGGERYILEMSITGEGTVVPAVGEHEYEEGSIVSISASPDDDWKFTEWQLNGAFYSDEAETAITMDSDKSVTALFEWDGSLTKATGTIKVGAMSFNEVQVNEVDGVEGATHFGIFGVGSLKEIGGDNPLTFQGTGSAILEIYDSEETLLATGTLDIPASQGEHPFTVGLEIVPPGERYTLEMSITGEGTVVPAVGSHQYNEGTVVDISAVPDDNWKFAEWQLDGVFYSDEAEATITMDADKSVTAIFEWDGGERYTLEMSITGEGTVVPAVGEHEYEEGSIVSISASPDDDWKFTEWQLNGAFYSDEAETAIIMDSDKSVTALFEWDGSLTKATGTIKVGAMNFNEVQVNEVDGVEGATYFGISGVGSLKEIGGGNPVSFTGAGSAILEIYDSEETLLATGILDIPVSQGEHPFTVGLEIVQPGEQYILDVSITGEGTVAPAVGLHQYNEGTVVDISAVPDDDWLFSEWQLNGAFYSDEAETTITMDSDKELTAVFTLKEGVRKATGIIKVSGMGFNDVIVNEVYYVDGASRFSVTEAETNEQIGEGKYLTFSGTGSTTLQILDSEEVVLATGTLSIPASSGEHEFEVKLELSP